MHLGMTRRQFLRGAAAMGGTVAALGAGGRAAAGEPDRKAETPAATVRQHVLFDGESGATRDCWNRGIGVKWRNPCGDWRDAEDKAQGPAAFAAASVPQGSGPRPVAFDVTGLVRRWLNSGNTGLLLRARGGSSEFASRENEAAALRPALTVAAGGGKKTCPCTADATLNTSTYKSLGLGPALAAGAAVMQFDLSGVAGEVQGATLTLHATKSAGPAAVEVMRLDAPTVHTGGGTPQPGLATDYPYDRGIAAHRDVVFATDFSGTDWRQRHFTEGDISDPTFGEDPALRSTYIRGQFTKGNTGSCGLEYRWTAHNLPEPEEIYFRYYVFLENDFGSTVDGNKMPGLAGRYGIWNGRYWSRVDGNGGSPTTGRARESKAGRVLSGWSMRAVALQKPADDNPYRDLTGVNTYAYHADQRGSYGDHWRWGTVLLAHERWYSIEQYAKINTVKGPVDEMNNGAGQADGVLRAWLDGVQVFEKTDIRFRHHPAIKIDEVWLNWYHGGTQPAAATHHYRMTNVVVARSYIGPLSRQVRGSGDAGA